MTSEDVSSTRNVVGLINNWDWLDQIHLSTYTKYKLELICGNSNIHINYIFVAGTKSY